MIFKHFSVIFKLCHKQVLYSIVILKYFITDLITSCLLWVPDMSVYKSLIYVDCVSLLFRILCFGLLSGTVYLDTGLIFTNPRLTWDFLFQSPSTSGLGGGNEKRGILFVIAVLWVLRICMKLMRIRIRLITFMRIRILIFIWCGSGSDSSPWCGYGSGSSFWLVICKLMRIRIQLIIEMRIRINNTGCGFVNISVWSGSVDPYPRPIRIRILHGHFCGYLIKCGVK